MVDGPHGQRVVARGAVDDKGQVAMWLTAFRAWHAETGTLPCRVTVLIEGEEEIGSANFKPFVAANRDELRADIAVISDTGMWDIDTPAITTSLRGIVYIAGGPEGRQPRPAFRHVRRLGAQPDQRADAPRWASCKDANGRVQVPGFYDGVRDISAAQAAQWAALGFDEAAFLGDIGLTAPYGEAGRGGAGAAVGAADLRHQRHLGRLPGAGHARP